MREAPRTRCLSRSLVPAASNPKNDFRRKSIQQPFTKSWPTEGLSGVLFMRCFILEVHFTQGHWQEVNFLEIELHPQHGCKGTAGRRAGRLQSAESINSLRKRLQETLQGKSQIQISQRIALLFVGKNKGNAGLEQKIIFKVLGRHCERDKPAQEKPQMSCM